jgi:hypothetical protein
MPTQSEISLNPTSTKGSILTSNGSSRSSLVAGSNGQILSAQSSAASGLEYKTISTAGAAFELIASSNITANTASAIFSSVDTTYTSYRLIVQYRTTDSSGGYARIRFNAENTNTYKYGGWYSYNATVAQTYNGDTGILVGVYGNSSDTNVYTVGTYDIFCRSNGASQRNFQFIFKVQGWNGAASSTGNADFVVGVGKCTGATGVISSIGIEALTNAGSASSFSSGSLFRLYGFRR